MFRKSSSLVLAAALAMIGVTAPGFTQPAPQITANAPRRAKKGLFNGAVTLGSWWRHTYLNHGPTVAQQQRAARKARNVRRHKRHVRGAK